MDIQPTPQGQRTELTVRDVVVLSLLAEGPIHGYAMEAELRRREVRDWAGISRPQVYKSLDKLHRLGLAAHVGGRKERGQLPRGPQSLRLKISSAGRRALIRRLDDPGWATTRDRPLFLTWLALCDDLPKATVLAQIVARKEYLRGELARERGTLDAIDQDPTVPSPFPKAMVSLMVAHFEVELTWLAELNTIVSRRPEYDHGPMMSTRKA